jgi:hypothetical protein
VRFKRVRHRAPPGVLHEDAPLLCCRLAAFGFYGLQGANRGEIGLRFLLEAAFSDGVGAGYAEISGKG